MKNYLDAFLKTAEFLLRAEPEPPAPPPALLKELRSAFQGCGDFNCQMLQQNGIPLALCWVEGLASSEQIAQQVLRALGELERSAEEPGALLRQLSSGGVWAVSPQYRQSVQELESDLLQGRCALLCGQGALSLNVNGPVKRGVEEPRLERAVLGARDAFTETYRVNTALVRQRLRSSELKVREFIVGQRSHTKVGLLYMEGIAKEETVATLAGQLSELHIDGVTAIGDLEAYLAPPVRGAFPQFLCTERPDRFSRFLLQGRVGILCDGLPLGLCAPCSLPELLRVAEDRAQHALASSALLLLRYAALFIALLAPALYTAVAMYHPEMIPVQLLQSIISAKQDVPFSTAAEMLGMLAAFGLLEEAGLRLPEAAGTTVSIIGTLIVGQSAVEARVISPIAVIVVALAGIAGYTLPNQQFGSAVRLWRFLLVLCAVAMGMFGFMAGAIVLLWRLCGMECVGVSYLYPLTDGEQHGLLRGLLHFPIPMNTHRSAALCGEEQRRQA